jgi:acyl-CoA synthetase (AMP-forming)/AMP-acid ligase II
MRYGRKVTLEGGERPPSSRPTPPMLTGNFAQRLLATAELGPGAEAIVAPEGTIDYGSLWGRARGIANALLDAGVTPGDRVAIFLGRGIDACAAFVGALAAGSIVVIVNETLKARQIDHILHHSRAAVLLSTAASLDALGRRPNVTTTMIDVETIGIGEELVIAPRIGADVAQIIYTSGSTGLPKGVTLSHANLWAGMHAVVEYLGISSADRIASLLPFSFDYGLNQLLCAIGTGATLIIERSPVAPRVVSVLREQSVTVLPAVPPLWLQLLNVAAFREPMDALRVMTNTGGRLPTDAVRALREAQPHAQLFLMFGLTEAFRSSYLSPDRVDRKPDSVGQAIPGAQLLVIRDDGTLCDPGEPGELVHRGPTVAMGYWDDPELTDAVFRPDPGRPPGSPAAERVVFSGDLVYRDEEGDLHFVARRDTMIKTLGYRVSPDEVVEVLYASGEVAEAVVAAEPDDHKGSKIVAYVVLREGGDVDRLASFCADEAPRYMQPARIETRASLDRTPSGKYDVRSIAASKDPT